MQNKLISKENHIIERKIIIEKDIDRNLCITINELKALFDYFPRCNPKRLGFMIMATMGLRPSEVCNLNFTNILNDFKYIKYTVRKPKNKYYKKTKTLVTEYKRRTTPILYETLRQELKEYCLKNYFTFKNGRLFKFSEEMFRRELFKIRNKVYNNELTAEIWKGFTEKATENIWLENNTRFKQSFRITPYSCRRFYNTYKLWTEYGGNIVLSTRDLGHSHIDTNMIYSYSPDKIGLTSLMINHKITFNSLFGNSFKGQTSLIEF